MVNVMSPSHAAKGQRVELVVVLDHEELAEVRGRYADGDLPFRVVKGRDGNRRIRFVMPDADEVMFKLRGSLDGPRLVRVKRA
ncbi:MAG TPA: hypothetical protein VEI02_08365 [Planctomycetota bacterium]|nr:hypothetical protein [Planctomycetota bacterium]